MVRFVLIALLAGCYRPSIIDCVDRCDESGLCPGGLECHGGFCTSGTACTADASTAHDGLVADVMTILDATTDAMVDAEMIDASTMADAMIDAPMIDAMVDAEMPDAGIDAMTDAEIDAEIDAEMPDAAIDAMVDAMVDAMPDAAIDGPPDAPPDAAPDAAMPDAPIVCPAVPTTSPCTSVNNASPQPPYCFTVCTSTATPNQIMTLSGTWHVAVIESTAEETAAVAALGGITSAWLALDQMGMTQATMVDENWHWIMQPPPLTFTAWAPGQPDDGDGTENHVEDCGAIGPNGWTDENCTIARPFLIEPF